MEDSTAQKPPKRLKPSVSSGLLIDWISDLPESIVQHILSFLPVKDAIKFCTLSRQWDSLWTSIRNLLFSCESVKHDELDRFASFVDKTLMRYTCSKINKFSVAFYYGYLPKEKVESWICFAKCRNVEELCVDFKNGRPYITQGNLYSIRSVTKMSLTAVYVYYSHRELNVRWTSLKVLSILDMLLEGGIIRAILLGSPLIEVLTLRQCRFTKNYRGDKFMIDTTRSSLKELVIDSCGICDVCLPIEIKCPNLISLTIVGKMHIKALKVVDASSLSKATIDFSTEYSTSSVEKDLARHKRMQKSLLYKLRCVKKFSVGTRSLQVLSIRKVDCAPFGRSGRKILKVNMNLNESYIPGIAALLKSSPDLEQLTINILPTKDSEFKLAGFSEKDHFIEANYWRSEMSTVKCLFQNLKSVDIVGFVAGSSSTLEKVMVELVEFLLAKAKVLQKLIIHAGPTYSHNNSWTPQKLLCCQRASPNAMVVFKNYIN